MPVQAKFFSILYIMVQDLLTSKTIRMDTLWGTPAGGAFIRNAFSKIDRLIWIFAKQIIGIILRLTFIAWIYSQWSDFTVGQVNDQGYGWLLLGHLLERHKWK